jgi:hypothetical protein
VLSYEIKLCGSAIVAIVIGLFLYWKARRDYTGMGVTAGPKMT